MPGDPNVYYAGAASGGIFKTTDNGAHWDPVFDREPVSSIGSLAVAPSDPNLRTVAATSDADDAHARMLREYLMDHSNAIADEGVGGTLRYARFAAHTAEYRSQADEQP